MAQRTVAAGVAGEDQRPLRRIPRRPRPAGERVAAPPAPLYITHLIEDGYDPLFVQQQVGHSYASTTALYTSVSSDFRNRALRAALDRSIQAALGGDAGPREGWSVMARRKLDFHWNLRRLMAAHQMWKTTDLIPLLRERGVELSASQVYRLVTDKPERLSMKVLIALCDILDCTPADLIDPYAEAGRPPQDRGRARRGGGGAQARPAAGTGPHPRRGIRPGMPRPRRRQPDPARFPPCARCGQCYPGGAGRWPEGRVCKYCYLQARLRTGTCAGCGALTSLPGLNAAGQPPCTRCSGIPARFRCGCGREVTAGERGRCWWCVLAGLVTDTLAGPGGEVPAHLRPLADGLVSMHRPQSGVAWLRRSAITRETLRDLAQ